ncbi:MAG: alpha-amylase family glycosyl hydrolase [Desulfobacterales bacterium]|jgi:sucrose phosphorylase
MEKVKDLLIKIYGEQTGALALERLAPIIEKYGANKRKKISYFSQEDVVLITYGDSLKKGGEPPLATLHAFANQYLKGAVSNIHFLPFFPYSSDDGFSVMDFFKIDPALGTWQEVAAIGQDFELMFDYVVNHFSAKGQWFQNYLAGNKGFEEFAIEVDPATDLSMVTRPRSLPLLSEYKKENGQTVHLWTTFSADQIDFNFKSLDVLEQMIEVLLFYAQQGATILRLDAIAYLWKEIGTNCIHLPQTHDMVKLFRAVLDLVAPDVMILTETNVPHTENISYFGDGHDEAQMVYNFTLPPLLFYTFATEDATILSDWAKGLHLASDNNTFFNFTASHDGIGVRPLEGILEPSEIEKLIEMVKSNDGQVSYKRNPDGSDSPYELNITYVDAILGDRSAIQAEKFLTSQSIQYALPGVPATYIHSLLGSRNWVEGIGQTGRARTINREKLQVEKLISELKQPDSFRARVFFPYRDLIRTRKKQPAFHPNADFEILDLDPKIFGIKRSGQNQTIVALANISSQAVSISLPAGASGETMMDLISGEYKGTAAIQLKPYEYLWLEESG